MTTFLFNLLAIGAERVPLSGPLGWTLVIISISVVFVALIILYFIYTFLGKLSSGEIQIGRKSPDKEVAAAIALALACENGGGEEEIAAIATALHLCDADSVHDIEPGIITIVPRNSNWNIKGRNFRKSINK